LRYLFAVTCSQKAVVREDGERRSGDEQRARFVEASEGSIHDRTRDVMAEENDRIVAETRRCSTSWLQRKLSLGYNRAARIVETMERRGLVGPANGAKDREVLIDPI
jgi:S-DNA-T family DNA segregation ATPase FtsK/SpoIIIE